MSAVTVPAGTVPAPRLRARPVNTSHVTTAKTTTTTTKASVTKRVASPKSSTIRPRTPATNAATTPVTSHSLTRRARSNVKAVAPGRVPAAAAEESDRGAVIAGAPLTPIPTNTSHLSGHNHAVHVSSTSTATLKKSASHPSKRSASAVVHPQHSRCASRLDSVCSSLPGSSSDRGSAHRLRPPPVPLHAGQVTRSAPLTRAATAECVLRSARQPASVAIAGAAPQPRKKSSPPPESQFCSRTQSAHDVAAPALPPPSPRRVLPQPTAAPTPATLSTAATAVSGRTFASAPASRVSSVNSRLAEGRASGPARATTRTRVVRTAGKRSASSNSEATPPSVPSNTTPPVPAAFTTAPPRSTGMRPLLAASRRVAQKENAASTAAGGSRLRGTTTTASTTAATGFSAAGQSQVEGSNVNRSARTASRQAPLSGRRVAGSSPSRKATRRPSDAAGAKSINSTTTTDEAALSLPPPPSSKFQQTHTGCPPPLSFGGSVRGPTAAHNNTNSISNHNNHLSSAAAAAVPKGPVSPIKRTSTACPSGAQVYPAAPLLDDDAARDSASLGTAGAGAGVVVPDSAFSCPWLKPGAFSTPTNRDGGRESSEAPTVPYEGSTGQRASLSLSPRTDFDSMSVSGRLSYGM